MQNQVKVDEMGISLGCLVLHLCFSCKCATYFVVKRDVDYIITGILKKLYSVSIGRSVVQFTPVLYVLNSADVPVDQGIAC